MEIFLESLCKFIYFLVKPRWVFSVICIISFEWAVALGTPLLHLVTKHSSCGLTTNNYVYCWKALYVLEYFIAYHPCPSIPFFSNILSLVYSLPYLFVFGKYKIIIGSFSLTKWRAPWNFEYKGPKTARKNCVLCCARVSVRQPHPS